MVRAVRLLAVVAVVVALVVQFVVSSDRSAFTAGNFFSYFTVLSNMGAVVLLALLVARPSRATDPGFVPFRGAVTLYMGVTALVYAVLLAPASADVDITEPWVDAVLHEIAPLAVLVDWFLDPPRRRLPRSVLGRWLAFPAAYLAYSLIRGSVVDWYPYPFLNPDEAGGYGGVAAYSVGVVVVIVAIGAVLRWWAGRRAPAGA